MGPEPNKYKAIRANKLELYFTEKYLIMKVIRFHNQISLVILLVFSALSFTSVKGQTPFKLEETFDSNDVNYTKVGRGECVVENGKLTTKGVYASFGNTEWKNYEISFKARVPSEAEFVQIWAGFRAANRTDRYTFGLRGGTVNNIVLQRMGYMATDKFLGLRNLENDLKVGEWYKFKLQVCDDRIRLFFNDEKLPRFDVVDENASFISSGQITLGGGWIENEFDDLVVRQLPDNYFDNINQEEYINPVPSIAEKEKKRQSERSVYKTIIVDNLNPSRTELSLNGNWLFMPDQNIEQKSSAFSPDDKDENWHIMPVPNFWNPIKVWLHGESFEGFNKGVSDAYIRKEEERCAAYTFDTEKTKVGWYRHWVEMPENIKGKQVELTFDGISALSEIYVNGLFAGSNIGMFGEIKIDAGQYIKPGKNLIAVKVARNYKDDIKDPNEIVDVAVTVPVTNSMLKDIPHSFYRGAPGGIWQNVKLTISNPVKIEDVFVNTNLNGAEFEVTIKNNSKKNSNFSISTLITDNNDNSVLFQGETLKKVELQAGEEKVINYSIENISPKFWSPFEPNLYDFNILLNKRKEQLDNTIITSGFRVIESKNGLIYLNNQPLWLRGGNHTPYSLIPYDREMADKFTKLMQDGNMFSTRSVCGPHNDIWLDASDRNGIFISQEGTWPWLMIHSSMPGKELLDIWESEFLNLVKKCRNHPSLLIWTVNNEMKFYDNEPDLEKAKLKMKIISDVVKKMRKIAPNVLICFDSNYRRTKRFGEDFFKNIDDGDIDDVHRYYNWYRPNVFSQFNGEFQKSFKNENRPLISQEMSTGYPNNEFGHPTRAYTFQHYNPQSLVGNNAYDFSNPKYFLEVNNFITKELAEALRRSNEKASGIIHFALITWFRNVYDKNNIQPYPTYFGIKKALSPVLVSAELWGRHFYAGEKLPTRICVVNDKEEASSMKPSVLQWSIESLNGEIFTSGKESIPEVKYYGREWISPEINLPVNLPSPKSNLKLKLRVIENGVELSNNEYDLLVTDKEWSKCKKSDTKIVLVDNNNYSEVLDGLDVPFEKFQSVEDALKKDARLYLFTGLDLGENCTKADLQKIKSAIAGGKNVLVLNTENAIQSMYPDYVKGILYEPVGGDIVNMEVEESPVFNDIEPMELRYFNNNKRENPRACYSAYKISRDENVQPLAMAIKIHGYLGGDIHARSKRVEDQLKGFPIVEIKDNGRLIISTMALDKANTDPIAAKLLSNMIDELSK